VAVPRTSCRLLAKDQRRAQLIGAAATAFARNGFASTSLEEVAHQADITKVLIYRHFASKTDLYQAVLNDTRERLQAGVGPPDQYTDASVRSLVRAACDNPDGFRLLFRHASREPAFAAYARELNDQAADVAERYLRDTLPDTAHRQWVARLLPVITSELILSWLDAGRPTTQDALVHTIRATSRALTNPAAAP
jgi:AcrR family transcriptional regulator